MKNLNEITLRSIPAAVLDPSTGRYIATAADIALGLGISHQGVTRAAGRKVHGGRYLDIADVIANRKKTPGRGRPKNFKSEGDAQ